ncbi:transcription factor IIIC subunit delta N-term-domain-containing protein [Phaeosphaeriaceae sp. PMI808]|nr:transcription factor IIIC subunit delta N-term-domain-containing protein [Phaeosphaeriaceae sp. PMI808]
MADVMELRCWPSCLDALDWSEDGIIALASDERVELLFPNTVTFDREQDVAQWQTIPLQVPWFTDQELPTKEPAPLANYSIGEEISASAPIAIAWSSSGLAKHRGCALAALTANLVLSIWSADGKPHEASSWDRRLIVNNALANHFSSNATETLSHISTSSCERLRLRTRIRAFAWAPALPNLHASTVLGSRLSYGQHILAICNDDNQIVLMAIESPTTTYGDSNWNAKVVSYASLTVRSGSIFSTPSCFDEVIAQQRHISRVSWSPWIAQVNCYKSIIVYATNHDVHARVVTCTLNGIGLDDEVVYPNIEMRYNGLIKWSPIVDDKFFTLALFTKHGLLYMKISTTDASVLERATHDLDGRWDQVSGAIWDTSQHPTHRLHFSSLFSTIQSSTAVLEASSDRLVDLNSPSWRDQIENSAALFSAKNELRGNSKMKVWGLAISPLGDFIATCHSAHPSDMIEYGSPSDRRGTVAISALLQYRQMRQNFPSSLASADGILFSLKKLVEHTVEESDQIPAFVEEIVGKLVKAHSSIKEVGDNRGISSSKKVFKDLEMLVIGFRQAVLFDQYMLKDRFTILASHSCNTKNGTELSRILIAHRLAIASLNLPTDLSRTSFSAEIRTHHQQVKLLMQILIGPDDALAAPIQDHTNAGAAAPVLTLTDDRGNTGIDVNLDAWKAEICDFCSASIPFVNFASGTCTNGHHFPRCGLSFLTIQAPAITKYCGICKTPFLSEEFVFAQEADEQTADLQEHHDVHMYGDVLGEDVTANLMNDSGNDQVSESRDSEMGDTFDREYNGTEDGQAIVENVEPPATGKGRVQPHITLARVLFLACDMCIYCGSKFVG